MCTTRFRIDLAPIDLEVPCEAWANEEQIKHWIWENCRDTLLAGMKVSVFQTSASADNVEAASRVATNKQKPKQTELESRIQHLEAENSRLREHETLSHKAASSQLRYFACMSHEIRTPLSCIIGLSRMMVDMELEPQQAEYMKMILSSSDLLLAVVNDVLDWTKLETGSYNVLIQESNLQQALDSTVRSIQMQAQAKHVRIATCYDSCVPEHFTTDSRRLQQILYNLLGNAVKFSEKGGVVHLEVKIVDHCPTDGLLQTLVETEEEYETKTSEVDCNEKSTLTEAMLTNLWAKTSHDSLPLLGALSNSSLSDVIDESMAGSSLSSSTVFRFQNTTASICPHVSHRSLIRFEVTDYGIGIKEEDIDRIFLPFHQESSETESTYGGSGLGLTITYKLVQALGGKIRVESKPGEFTRFTVDLPFVDQRVDLTTDGLPNTRVLFIANDPEDVSFAAALDTFTDYGIAFDVFPNLSAAVKELCAEPSTAAHSVCLFHEELYEADSVKQLQQRHIPLLSFGPKEAIPATDAHILSIEQTLPCVLIKFLRNSILMKQSDARMSSESSSLSSLTESPQSDASSPKNLRILIAEDNVINQKILSRMLSRLGYAAVDIVDNGEKAIEQESMNEYDLIFMDVLMPKVDGLQACQAIQQRSRRRDAPYIVFVTAYISTDFKETCSVAGGDEVLTKPFRVEDIAAALARAEATRDSSFRS
jgi:signal transduction histidine kinase/ActR/RegA family two-component response regulator